MVSVVSFSLYIYIGAKIRNRLKTAGKRLCIVKDRPAMLYKLAFKASDRVEDCETKMVLKYTSSCSIKSTQTRNIYKNSEDVGMAQKVQKQERAVTQ